MAEKKQATKKAEKKQATAVKEEAVIIDETNLEENPQIVETGIGEVPDDTIEKGEQIEEAQQKEDLEEIKQDAEKIEENEKETVTYKPTGTIDKAVFVKFLDDLEEGLAHYAGRRTERLRREFVTDLTELVTKTRESLK